MITAPHPSLLVRTAVTFTLDHPDALVIVPNTAAGRELRRVTASSVRTRTLGQAARQLLVEAGLVPLEAGRRPSLIREALAAVPLEYLGPIVDRPATLDAITALLRELARASVSPAVLGAAASSARERDLAATCAAYWGLLAERGLFDPAAAEWLARDLAGPRQPLLAHGFAYMDHSQVHLVAALSDGPFPAAVTLPHLEGSLAFTEAGRTIESFRALGWSVQPRAPGDERRAGEVAADAFAGGVTGEPRLTVEEHEHQEREVRAVLGEVRRLLDAGVAPADVGIVTRDEASYLPVLESVAAEQGLPLTSAHAVPADRTPAGALALALVDANLEGFEYRATRQILASQLVHPLVNLVAAVRALGRRGPAGLDVWRPFAPGPASAALDRLALPAEGTEADLAASLLGALRALGLPERGAGHPARVVALNAVGRALRSLDSLEVVPLATFRESLKLALGAQAVPALLGRAGVRVHTPLALLGRTFRHVFVLGMNDGTFPGRPAEEPLLDTFSRNALRGRGVSLTTPATRAALERALFHACLSTATGSVVLTRPLRDAGGRATQPSPFLEPFTACRVEAVDRPTSPREVLLARALAGQVKSGGDEVTEQATSAGPAPQAEVPA